MGESLKYIEVYEVKPGEITQLIINFLETRGIDAEIIVDRVGPRNKTDRTMVPKEKFEEANVLIHEWEIGGFENTQYPEGSIYLDNEEMGDPEDLGGYFT
jgi:hypothetical protein